MSEIAARLMEVRERIERAALRANRDPQSIRLVAVSKAQPANKIREAYRAGQRIFGENYAQELREKTEAFADLEGLEWHFIGHLQSNKAKLVAPVARLVHTVDSEGLARELVKRAPGNHLRALLEVNVGSEPQKGGAPPDRILDLARLLSSIEGLELQGLMCVPPFDRPSRPFFARLREVRDQVGEALHLPLPELSMGMSGDFEEAIAEGATLVRVGTAIFGERQ